MIDLILGLLAALAIVILKIGTGIAIYESVRIRYKKTTEFSKPLAIIGTALLGFFLALGSYVMYPELLFGNYFLDAIILFITPLILDKIIDQFIKEKVEKYKARIFITTFLGGVVMMLSFAVTRVLLIAFVN